MVFVRRVLQAHACRAREYFHVQNMRYKIKLDTRHDAGNIRGVQRVCRLVSVVRVMLPKDGWMDTSAAKSARCLEPPSPPALCGDFPPGARIALTVIEKPRHPTNRICVEIFQPAFRFHPTSRVCYPGEKCGAVLGKGQNEFKLPVLPDKMIDKQIGMHYS